MSREVERSGFAFEGVVLASWDSGSVASSDCLAEYRTAP